MFREKIQDNYEALSPRFRSLADFILENTLDVGFLTATELARRVGVDPATVVRFSQELGYSGFRELSREIKRYINQQLARRYQKGAPEEAGLAGEIAVRIDELSDRILDLKADSKQIADVVKKIHQAQRIFVTSANEGYGLATLWGTYLNLIGLSSYAVPADPARAALLMRDAAPGDLLIALSLGFDAGAEVGHLLSAAKERGVDTISITTSPTLLPARQADTNLVVPSKTPSNYPSFDTLVGLLSLIWQALIAMDAEQADAQVKATINSLNHLVEQRDKVPAYDVNALQRLWSQD